MGQYSGERPWRRFRDLILVPQPAAGAEWTYAVPGGEVWRLRSIYAELQASAVVANRNARVLLQTGGLTFARLPADTSIAANILGRLTWIDVGVAYAQGNTQVVPMPVIDLAAGDVISSSTGGLDVGDQWQNVAIQVVRTQVMEGRVELGEMPELYVEVVNQPVG